MIRETVPISTYWKLIDEHLKTYQTFIEIIHEFLQRPDLTVIGQVKIKDAIANIEALMKLLRSKKTEPVPWWQLMRTFDRVRGQVQLWELLQIEEIHSRYEVLVIDLHRAMRWPDPYPDRL